MFGLKKGYINEELRLIAWTSGRENVANVLIEELASRGIGKKELVKSLTFATVRCATKNEEAT